MSIQQIYIGSDTRLNLNGLQSEGSYLNAATVTWNLYAIGALTTSLANGASVYVAASNGDYIGTIPSTATALLSVGQYYSVKFTASEGDVTGNVWMECVAVRYTP
jgi:hypothetical protein